MTDMMILDATWSSATTALTLEPIDTISAGTDWKYYMGWTVIVLMMASVPGNMLTVLACIKFKELRSPAHLLIINQSVGDLISAAMAINYTIPYMHSMQTSKYYCLLIQAGIFIGLETSVLNLMAISIDRFLAVVFTFQYHVWVTSRRVSIGICLLWAVMIVAYLLPFLGWNTWTEGSPCQSMYVLPQKFFNIFFTFPVLIALLLTAVGNIIICIIAVNKSRKVGDIEDKTKVLLAKTQLKVTKMLLRVVGTFYAFWMPYIIMNSLLRYPPSNWRENGVPAAARFMFAFTQSILVFSAVINPFIYATKDKDFRRAYCKLLGIKHTPLDYDAQASWTKSGA